MDSVDAEDPAPDFPTADVAPHLWRIWAKWSKTGKTAPTEGETYHPLICHLLDVAMVARQLWESGLPAQTRERLTRHLELPDENAAGAWIAFFAGLHDLGKASPGFQDQLNDTTAGGVIREWMREAGLGFADSEWVAHGAVSALLLGDYLSEQQGVGATLANQIASLVGGHHGVFPRQLELNSLKGRQQVGRGAWDTIRTELVAALRAGLRVPEPAPQGALTPADAMVFAGFVSVADWIGSDEHHFLHAGRRAAAPRPMSLASYAALAERRAVDALRGVRMDAFTGGGALRFHRTFGDLFPQITQPYDAQRAVIELADHLTGPALVILEAPMGEGKTEAALYLAEAWATTHDRQGAYIALPTQATSNQMFERVRRYLHTRFAGADYVAAHLVYGEAVFNDAYQAMLDQGRATLDAARSTSVDADADDDEQAEDASESDAAEWLPLERAGPIYDAPGQQGGDAGRVIAVEWFATPKRALLAPFGVGTIDQALLGVLQTRHFFVRLFGLAGKTVIVDEVHAYDTYMSALLERLLEWLGAFGTPVVLLSATLPRAKRAELQSAYARFAGFPALSEMARATAYPRLTWLSADGSDARAVVASSALSRAVTLDWLDGPEPDSTEGLAALGERLAEALRDGGCAAVICNTVTRAQKVYTALKRFFPGTASDDLPELDLFHARFPRTERATREKRVLRRFGKREDGKGAEGGRNPNRPSRAVLVATQVIEQSLDLDFDLMVSDLAPMDLLLQRSGRLHRHRENDSYRPKAVGAPRLIIPRPAEDAGCPQFPKSDEFVYDAHFLLRTWLALHQRTSIRLPEEIEPLVEGVYDLTATCPADAPSKVRAAWEQTLGKYELAVADDRDQARMRLVARPRDDTFYTDRNLQLRDVDEAPYADEAALALTRLGPPSVRVILLSAAKARQQREAKGQPPGRQATRTLLGRATPISHGGIAPALIQQEPPIHWKKSPWLRHARLLALDEQGQCVVETRGKPGARARSYTLTLDSELGVVIQRHVEADA